MTWEAAAKAKLDAINSSIPDEWRLPNIPSIAEQKDVTGPFIKAFLSSREIEITETDACNIAVQTCAGEWQAEEVTSFLSQSQSRSSANDVSS